MTSEPAGHGQDAEVVPLRAVPAVPGTEPAAMEPVYADVTPPGGRKPVLPDWLQSREALRHHARRVAGHAWHSARYHGLRSPAYLTVMLFWAVIGVVVVFLKWLRWWLLPVPPEVWADSAADGHKAWHRSYAVHKEAAKVRAIISAIVGGAAAAGIWALWLEAWWLLLPLAAAALPVLAHHGHPSGRRIVAPSHVPAQYEVLTQDVIARALGSLGLAGINAWLREGREIAFIGPVRQDGPGWRAELDLPHGVTATEVIERRDKLASGLRRPLGAVWPEPVTSEHTGRLEMWVGQEDVTTRKPHQWPLLKAGSADVFKTVPFGTDTRGRVVSVPLVYHNWLIGSMPRNGKTGTVRVLCCAAALDPYAEQWIHELKGTGDLDPLEAVSHRFVSGIDDDSIAYAAESLRLLRAEVEKRSPRVKSLPLDLCPEKRVTREIALKRSLRLWPIACTIDECQNLFAHPKYGKQAGADAEFIIKIGPAMGIVLILATQRPDKDSLPTGISGNVSLRFCLYVAGQIENDMILGTSAYKNGLRATMFRPELDAGLGYLKGATPAPKVARTDFLDVPQAKAVVARARAARERAGTLSGVAVGEDSGTPAREPLSDALAVFSGEAGLHWETLAARLADAFPDRWGGTSADAISAELRACGVPSVTVTAQGQRARGCRKDAIEALTG
jgi:S-DNA-T family DNA segregation ATPase FtsK/SpoIIIE